ncbi:DUF1028 domain-containing protein [Caldinitratiruptor microaerophilus]|uniref:Ntn-hydrolase superfamily protein n=1 Tax=Caldinitratiruptor microaerophilus TaxID=671077 RepID=A0AA35CP20_9FIRM|nr:DUF1028 domain-containing protein [Caldinitratiruptor microaerophilus]BDG62093.1 hypothetical protein caldi_31830 [Caldinitratiruptor microaerophilus]
MSRPQPLIGTFSIVARDPATGELGVAVQSRFLAVGAVVPWARAGVGAVATQARANVRFGPEGLGLLAQGLAAAEVLNRLIQADPERDHRQVAIVDARGTAAAWTGPGCLPWAGHHVGDSYACQGNILAGPDVVPAMARAFESAGGHLADRLLAALEAGQAAGGDSRGMQAAALLVVRENGGYLGGDRLVDLRVDDHPQPIAELRRLLELSRQTFLTPTPPERWLLDSPEKIQVLQSLLREVGVFDGAVSGELTYNTRGALAAWCQEHGLPRHDPSGAWVPGETIYALREAVLRLRRSGPADPAR